MKAISIWQPWAHLIACGLKKVETRSWSTSYRGPIAIHASKTTDDDGMFGELLREARILKSVADFPPMAHGAIVAVATIDRCVPVESECWSGRELIFGDFSAGRFAWVLFNARALTTPIPCRGAQGLFEVEVQA